ncbi:MAG: putative ATP-dependent DNA helicase PIF1 [Streblomastix strix]|uniref:ATP-dependent DNA helicase n=1 Tax=Streblomastix strix TaxID=222440 RepID=A0A5J4WDR3_9EUKA|nr:MAG: putative ATP-dependent DNA helicase PIF1 [Streblomastix strix]
MLHHIKGACNYENQGTVNGIRFEANRDAVQYLGLLADDQEWIFALKEAASLRMPQQLRELFIYILLFCNPENPQNIFNNFITQLSEDFIFKNNNDEKLSKWLAFLDISEIYGDIYPPLDTMIKCQCPDSYYNSFEYSAYLFKTNDRILTLENLNDTQRIHAQEIINAVNDESIIQRCFSLDGPAGTGKTNTYKVLYYILDSEGFNVLNCAYTGIAATPLPERRSIHSLFKFPVPITLFNHKSKLNMQTIKQLRELLKDADLLICDEAPLANKWILNEINEKLMEIRGNELPFRGIPCCQAGTFVKFSQQQNMEDGMNKQMLPF